jgi:hypothetical protein
MTPRHKTILIVIGCILGLVLAPAILIIFRDYVLAVFTIIVLLTCLLIFGHCMYIELYGIIMKDILEEEEILHSFHGDPSKMHFYKGFKKYFKGELSAEGLEEWLLNHPTKPQRRV